MIEDLRQLQDQPTSWEKLTPNQCTNSWFGGENKYRNVVFVTNYTTADSNNSALAISILPDYSLSTAKSELLALCPDAYLSVYKGSKKPESAPFLITPERQEAHSWTDGSEWAKTYRALFHIDPSEARNLALNQTDLGPQRYGSELQLDGPFPTYGFHNFYPVKSVQVDLQLRGLELYYYYWDMHFEEATNNCIGPRCDFLYCLAERPSHIRVCEVVFSPEIIFAIAMILSVKIGLISVALLLRCFSVVFTRWNDALNYFEDHDGDFKMLPEELPKQGMIWWSSI